MKKMCFLFAFIGIISIYITGCINPVDPLENEKQLIYVLQRNVNENKYEDFKKITNEKQVQKVADIVENVDWENRKVDMPAADYKFYFQFKSSNIQAKPITYHLWIGSNKDTVELVMEDVSNYVHLNKSQSSQLFEILTGRKLE